MRPLTEEQKIFAEENHNLIYSFLSKHGLSIEDWYDIAAIGYVMAVAAFDGNKAAFSSYAYLCMLSHVRQEMRKSRSVRRSAAVVSLNSPALGTENMEVGDLIAAKDDLFSELLTRETLLSGATERQKQILILSFFGYKQREIASKLNLSQAHISREIKKARQLVMCDETCKL